MRSRLKQFTLLVTLLAGPAFAVRPQQPDDSAARSFFDGQFGRALQSGRVPGLAVAVVRGDKTLLLTGYGVRRQGDPAAVTPDTRFYTASVTKTFTATAALMLAERGSLALDAPVRGYLPEWHVAPPADEHASVRDLLAHRVGLPRIDMIMWAGLRPADVVRRLAFVTPARQFRSGFTYQNQMYLAVGLAIERVAGMPLAMFLERNVLAPLAMTGSDAAGPGGARGADTATPHALHGGQPMPIAIRPREPYGGGALNASATDLARWLMFQMATTATTMAPSSPLGNSWLSEMHRPHTIAPASAYMPESRFRTYGLGWFVHDYHDRTVIQHGGSAEGWSAVVGFLPQERVGVAVVSNLTGSMMPTAIMYTVFDYYLSRPYRDWISEYNTFPIPQIPARSGSPVICGIDDRRPGVYANSVYGEISVACENGRLLMRYGPALVGELTRDSAGAVKSYWNDDGVLALVGSSDMSFESPDTGTAVLKLIIGPEVIAFKRSR